MHTVIENHDSAFSDLWAELYANDPQQNPFYDTWLKNSAAVPVQFAPQSRDPYEDRSFVVVHGDAPVFGCSLTVHTDPAGRRCLGYFGVEASTHVNPQTMAATNSFQPEAIHMLQWHMDSLINEFQPNQVDYLDPVSCGIMSPVTQVLLERGATPKVQQVQAINLDQSEHLLRRQLSPRHRALTSWAPRNLELEVVVAADQGVVSGVNSSSGWALCEELLKSNRAFYVRGYQGDQAVAESFFVHNSRTCQLVFAQQHEGLIDRPALYGLVWHGMLHARRLGCSHFDLVNNSATALDFNEVELLAQGFGGAATTRLKVSLAR